MKKYLVIGKPEHGTEGRYYLHGTVLAGGTDHAQERAVVTYGNGYYKSSDFIVVEFDASKV